MQLYVSLRDEHVTKKFNSSFFLTSKGRSLNIVETDKDFRFLREKVGLPKKARLYDFRHTFACQRLLSWYEEEKNIDALMVYLSTYLGHTRVIDTYWYLSAIPKLMSIVSKRFENFTHQIKGEQL